MAYVRREYPQWSWSFSRQQTFDACRRRYYYQYYGSHNGWEFSAPQEAALAYRLKKLGNLYTALGDGVHQTAEQIVRMVRRGDSVPSVEEIEEMIREHLRVVWRSSRDQRELFLSRPNRVPMLHEFYYGRGPSEEVVNLINTRASQCAHALAHSVSLQELGAEGTTFVGSEQFDTFELYGTAVYAVPDLLYYLGDEEWVIVDWKTGEQSKDDQDQVSLYALYVMAKYGVSVEKIKARLEYLSSGSSIEMQFSEEILGRIKEDAQRGMEQMQCLLSDKDLNKAQPISQFPLTSERYRCRMCNYLELCRPELGIETVDEVVS
ncbi:MAG: PD-(D/E)XK nuclease family protein [Firmicutes bacterium]|nr:PD-(D/E)XK nuclease family protein [Bacillota bacterium]